MLMGSGDIVPTRLSDHLHRISDNAPQNRTFQENIILSRFVSIPGRYCKCKWRFINRFMYSVLCQISFAAVLSIY